MSFAFREAARADVPAILAFLASAGETPGVADAEDRLLGVVDAEHAWLLLALDGDQIVGTIIAGWDGWRGSLYRLAVDPARRKEGIARALVEHAEAVLHDAGAPRVSALAISPDARAFWRRIGYEHDARVERYIKNLG
jgi:ribosomal protein S18 acetylase RimI-like enzyme